MRIGIVDAELVYGKHKFPNLACMKLSGYHKAKGDDVSLIVDPQNIKEKDGGLWDDDGEGFDQIYVSKVFTKTPFPKELLPLSNIKYGGTGFFFDKAEPLPLEIEHHMPDYTLYSNWVQTVKKPKSELSDYVNTSMGYTTRGCFRQCPFCVLQNHKKVVVHSPVIEFFNSEKKVICLLDDNILGSPKWKEIFEFLLATGKKIKYKQGMDIRLMTQGKAELINQMRYDGRVIFAFDNIADRVEIEDKLTLWRKYCEKPTMLYVLCGFDRGGKWDDTFWKQDIIDTFERIKILADHKCLPYIMRFEKAREDGCTYKGMYNNIASWVCQPQFFFKYSFREYCEADLRRNSKSSVHRYMVAFENACPDIAKSYFDYKVGRNF